MDRTEAARIIGGNNDNVDNDNVRVVKLRLPGRVFQTGPDSIEVTIPVVDMIQPFDEPFMRYIHGLFGAHGGTLWIEEQITRMQRDLLLRQIR